ncbi:MAG TPA: alpha/beta hydrolase [Stellaceae bacterium]|nr:alpha/beta hydrolase [Stellaceae bacterium]
MGGVVAQHFALRHPSRLVRLLLVATGAYTADPAAALARADTIARLSWDELTVAPIVANFFHKPPTPEVVSKLRRIALMASPTAAAEAARSNARSHVLDQLAAITVPTLIIQGRHDRARTPGHGAEMQRRIPNARLEIIDDAGHTPQLERPDVFHDIALPFLLAED